MKRSEGGGLPGNGSGHTPKDRKTPPPPSAAAGRLNGAEGIQPKEIINLINNAKDIDRQLVDDCLALGELYGESVYTEIIYHLTRLRLPPDKAKKHWKGMIAHMQGLNDKLGRNVGIHVAAGDYLANIKKYYKHPVLIEERALLNKEDSAYKDGLTGLFNRRFFDQEMPVGVARFRRFGIPFSLLMVDLDNFKLFNDKHGHQAGDSVLQTVAEVVGRNVRVYDRATRYGGEEFAIILHQTSRSEAAVVAEKIRAAVEDTPILHKGRNMGGITVSIGIATCPIDALDTASLVRRADQALYVAKRQRNIVVAFCDYNRAIPRDIQERRLMA